MNPPIFGDESMDCIALQGQCFQGDPDRLKAECSTDPNSTAR